MERVLLVWHLFAQSPEQLDIPSSIRVALCASRCSRKDCGYGCLKRNGCGRERASGPSSGRMNQPVGCILFTPSETDTFTTIR